MKKCIIWGTGKYCKLNYKRVINSGYTLIGFCDSSTELQGGSIDGYEVFSIEHTVDLCAQDRSIIIVIGVFDLEFKKQIRETFEKRFPKETELLTVFDACNPGWRETENNYYTNLNYKWDVNILETIPKWIHGIDNELSYWKNSVLAKNGIFHEPYERIRKNRIDLSEDDFMGYFTNENNIVLDIGCGLMSQYAEKKRMIPVDALAYFYNKMNASIDDGYKKDYNCSFGMFEFLSCYFDRGFADVIHVGNALDHCMDPFKGLVECIKVLKINGTLYLKHRRAVALYENWQGLHQWNLDLINSDFVIWGKDNAVNVNRELSDYVDVITKLDGVESRDETYLTVIIKKKKEIEDDKFFSKDSDLKALSICIKCLFEKMAGTAHYEK